ncbi:MAG: GNAT family N-acetyltransferase [Saprospiraceae bacterium]|nr:GNAT family N-acetyltransferase [Saprospiraceae bacterium]
MEFIPTQEITEIVNLRKLLYQELTAPIDAMWELLYIASAQAYFLQVGNQRLGYCCIDEKNRLLQLFLLSPFKARAMEIIQTMIDSGLIVGAQLSSSTPTALNACLFHTTNISTHTFCFEHTNESIDFEERLALELVSEEEIPAIKAFLKKEVGMEDTFGYTENLVNRKEIFRAKQGNTIVATSECRLSDTQSEYADLGMIVNQDFRGQGFATEILQWQVNRVLKLGRKPICSTTIDNIASQKAIKKAGFYCSNIIFDIDLTPTKTNVS